MKELKTVSYNLPMRNDGCAHCADSKQRAEKKIDLSTYQTRRIRTKRRIPLGSFYINFVLEK